MTEQQIKDFIDSNYEGEHLKNILNSFLESLEEHQANLEKQEMLEQHNYKPLPYFLEILDSPIEGQGLFLVNDDYSIEEYTTLGRSHLLVNGELERLPLGGHINHSDTPNCKLEWEGNTAYLHSIKNINPGEELTLNYFNELCGVETIGYWETDCTLEPYIEQGILNEDACCKQSPCTVTDKTNLVVDTSNNKFFLNGEEVNEDTFWKTAKEVNKYIINTQPETASSLSLSQPNKICT